MISKHICILGAGLSGLSVAWKKISQGHKVLVIESSSQIGGVLQSEKKEGYLLDYSANTLSVRNPSTLNILEEMKVLPHAIEANPKSNKRFIIRNGQLVSLPTGFSSFFTSSFLSTAGKLRMLMELFLPRGNLDNSESVASFIARRLGKEALDFAANPFIAGIYACRPETLDAEVAFPTLHALEKKDRSLFLGGIKKILQQDKPQKTKLLSFPNGMNQLIEIISSSLEGIELEMDKTVKKVSFERDARKWKVSTLSKNGDNHEFVCDEVISTLPVHKLSEIHWNNLNRDKQLEKLTQVTQFPICLVFFGIDSSKVTHILDGFGFLVPEREDLSILGTLFSSTLFPNRAPRGKVLLTTFVGGERLPELALAKESEIYKVVENDLRKTIGLQEAPEFKSLKRWKQGIPLPDRKMKIRREAARALSRANPGLYFSGSAFNGVSLPNCLDG